MVEPENGNVKNPLYVFTYGAELFDSHTNTNKP